MTQKIRYCGRREDGHMGFISLPAKEALAKGKSFEHNGYQMEITEFGEPEVKERGEISIATR